MQPAVAVCAPNAFKGTVSAATASRALAAGVLDEGWSATQVPVADGGDGTLDVLLAAAGPAARSEVVRVAGPLGRPRLARLGWIGETLAVVEMAESSGLRLLRGRRLDALHASSLGAGQLLVAALERGARRIVVGVGGSASTDGGAGILAALGAELLDADGRPISPTGAGLAGLRSADLGPARRRLEGCLVEVAADVRSPLFGRSGAAHVFAPQKGAGPGDVAALDAGLRHWAGVIEAAAGRPQLASLPGAGAAGGAAFALAAVGASVTAGAALVCDLVGLDQAIERAALVITGEGRLDEQTAAGKAPAEVAQRARALGVPCIAVAGSVAGGEQLFSATLALDALGADPLRHARRLLRLAGRRAVELHLDGGAQP